MGKLKSGGKLRPARNSKKQPKVEFEDKRLRDVLAHLWSRGLLATQGSYNRLYRWFSRMATGSMVDLRTPFFAKKGAKGLVHIPQDAIVESFQSRLKAQLVKFGDLGEVLWQWEQEHAERVGPQSMFKGWKSDGPTKAAAVFSDKPMSAEVDSKAVAYALDKIEGLLRPQSVELISTEEAIAGTSDDPEGGMDTGTNSGLPYVVRPWKGTQALDTAPDGQPESDLCYEYTVRLVNELVPILTHPRTKTSQLPYLEAVVGQRLVQKGKVPFSPKSKRVVIAMPKHEAILGKRASVGIMASLKEVTVNGVHVMAAWHPIWFVDEQMQIMLREAEKVGQTVLSGDISNFDATVPPWLLWEISQRIATWVRGGESYVKNLLYMMIFKTRLWTPTGSYGPGPSSMKSGSWATSLLGSMTNLFFQYYGEALGLYTIRHVSVLGDDFVLSGDGVSPENTSTVFKHFGMEAHPDKQFFSRGYLQFLQRLHALGRIGGIASVNRTLGSALSLERLAVKPKDWNKFAYVVQALSKLQNTTFHPAFDTLVDFVASGDALQLGKNLSPQDLVAAAGTAGERALEEEARKPWKQLGSGVGFDEWTVNGVLRGETLPHDSLALFKRVYGRGAFQQP